LLAANGSYLKTACVLRRGFSHDEAYKACSDRGMKLYTIFTNDSIKQMNSFLIPLISDYWSYFWVDGKGDVATNEWYSFGSGNSYRYDKSIIPWVTNSSFNSGSDCLASWVPESIYKYYSYQCYRKAWALCEYGNSSAIGLKPPNADSELISYIRDEIALYQFIIFQLRFESMSKLSTW
jgi:hypothetical protein